MRSLKSYIKVPPTEQETKLLDHSSTSLIEISKQLYGFEQTQLLAESLGSENGNSWIFPSQIKNLKFILYVNVIFCYDFLLFCWFLTMLNRTEFLIDSLLSGSESWNEKRGKMEISFWKLQERPLLWTIKIQSNCHLWAGVSSANGSAVWLLDFETSQTS